jgi:hypothetical protein
MSNESTLRHPFVPVEMIPFSVWALTEGEEELADENVDQKTL